MVPPRALIGAPLSRVGLAAASFVDWTSLLGRYYGAIVFCVSQVALLDLSGSGDCHHWR